MDRVEKQVRLPAGAASLDKYARYYTVDDSGRVVAIYTTIVDPTNDFYDLPIGERRWLKDDDALPGIADGGCMVVNILFNPSTGTVERAICNGLA